MWITVECQNGIMSFECKKVCLAEMNSISSQQGKGWSIGFYSSEKYPAYQLYFDNEQDAKFKYDVILAELAGQTMRFEQKDAVYMFEGMNC